MTRSIALIIILASIVTFIEPTMFSWVKGDAQVVVLGVVMLGMGMTLGKEGYQILTQRPLDISIGAVTQYTIMPLLAIDIARAFNLSPGLTLGLILVGTCPSGVSSNVMSFLTKGDITFSVDMTTISTALTSAITPLWMVYLIGQTVEMDGWGVFKFMLLVTLSPVVIGLVANILLHKKYWFGDVHTIVPAVVVAASACIVDDIATVHDRRSAKSTFVMILAIAAHNIGGYALDYYSGALASMNTARERTLAIEVGVQNAGLATGLSAKFFPGNAESAVAAVVAYAWHSVSGTILGNLFTWWDKRQQ